MIRREIVTSAGVAAGFLVAGFLAATQPSTQPSTPVVEPAPDVAETRQDEPVEPPPGYMARTQPFLSWPDAPSDNPTLTWPPYGCDAGMWSIPYTVEPIEPGRTRVRGIDHQDVETSVDVLHEPGWDFDFYPMTPITGWVVTTSPDEQRFRAQHLSHGTPTCTYERAFGDGEAETRAIVSEDGIVVYTLGDEVWAVTQIDNDCELVGEREVPRGLAQPHEQRFGVETMAEHGLRAVLAAPTQVLVDSPDFAVHFATSKPVQKLALGASTTGNWVIFWDEETTYLKVLDLDGSVRWELDWATHPFRDPITHVTLHSGLLSVRGPLDSYPGDEDLIRVFDTHTNEIIGGVRAEQLSPRPLVWRWPAPAEVDSLTSCLGGGGLFGGCDGEVVTRKAWQENGRILVKITRDSGAEPTVCSTGVPLPDGAEIRAATTMDYTLGIYARTDDELLAIEFDLDCEPRRSVTLPRALLSPRAITEVRDRTKYPSYWHLLKGGTELRIAAEGELGHIVFAKHLELQPAAHPVTHVDVVDEYFVVRGALDTSPWSTERDRIKAYDIRTGHEVLIVDL